MKKLRDYENENTLKPVLRIELGSVFLGARHSPEESRDLHVCRPMIVPRSPSSFYSRLSKTNSIDFLCGTVQIYF